MLARDTTGLPSIIPVLSSRHESRILFVATRRLKLIFTGTYARRRRAAASLSSFQRVCCSVYNSRH